MKRQDDPNKATRAVQRANRLRELTKGIGFLYDRLERGESLEELVIDLDIRAAGGVISESSHKVWREGLEIIREAQEAGADRDTVISHLRKVEKVVCKIAERERHDRFCFARKQRLTRMSTSEGLSALCDTIPQDETAFTGNTFRFLGDR